MPLIPTEQEVPAVVGMQQPAADPMAENQASPEEQAQYDQIVNKLGTTMHSPQTSGAVLRSLSRKGASVSDAVAKTAVAMFENLERQIKASGDEVSEDAMFEAAGEVIPMLVELGSAAGIFKLDMGDGTPGEDGEPTYPPETQRVIETAFAKAVHYYGENMVKDKSRMTPQLQQDAERSFLQGVAREADDGQLDPEFGTAPQGAEGMTREQVLVEG